jgi:hypothetical protein
VLSAVERGRVVRYLAARDHIGPHGDRVRVGRSTLDRWILAEGDALVAPFTARAEAKRQAGEPSRGGYDDLETIDLRAALGLESKG